MTRNITALIGFVLLAGCSGGDGGDPAASGSPSSTPPAQPEFLVATPAGLWRGQATGKGNIVFARPNLQQDMLFLSEEHVYYHRVSGGSAGREIWTVNADGTGDRALINTPDTSANTHAARGPWVLYTNAFPLSATPPDGPAVSWRSVRVDTGQHAVLSNTNFDFTSVQVGTTAIFTNDVQITSINFDGTNYRRHGPVYINFATPRAAVEPASFIYEANPSQPLRPIQQVFSVSLAGSGQPIPLEDGLAYSYYAGHRGDRVVYQRCTVLCDVLSVQLDGTQTAVLTTHPANEAVQGIIGNQVIIRRNLSGNDPLIAVPIAGGSETLLMTMTDSEFVNLVAGDLLILRRPSGTWSLDLNGALKQLGTVVLDFGVTEIGNAVCGNKGNAVWCMPLDGSATAVKIADEGKVVGAL